MQVARELRVVAGDPGAAAPRAGVGEDRQVPAGGQAELVALEDERPELHEVVPRARGAELGRRLVAQAADEARDPPALAVEDVVVGAARQRGPHAEAGLRGQSPLEEGRLLLERGG